MNTKEINLLNKNKIIGYATDTVYGLIAVVSKENIKKLNKLKERNENKPIQILLSSLKEAKELFGYENFVEKYLENNFNSKTSYIVKVKKMFQEKYLLDSFKQTILFRIPNGEIHNLLITVGPLLATSANKHGQKPLNNPEDIKKEFGVEVFGKQINNINSKIISLLNNEVKELRS